MVINDTLCQQSPKDSSFINFRLSKKEFLKKYGMNDTTKAIIEFYFEKRRNGIIKICSIPVIGLTGFGSFVIVLLAYNNTTGYYASRILLVSGLILIYSTYVSAIVFPIIGIVQTVRYSKKNLYKAIMVYNHNKTISDKLKKRLEKEMKN